MTEAAKREEPEEEPAVAPEGAPATEEQKDLVVTLQEEVAALKDSYLRAVAETENVRTRAKRDMEENSKYAVTKFARDMVNIVENLGRAAQSITPEARAQHEVLKQVGDGIDMTMQELLAIFERNGIKRVNPLGEKFDYNLHQAVSQVPDATNPPGTILHVLQAGYVLHDRLLRPAMVTVATQPQENKAS